MVNVSTTDEDKSQQQHDIKGPEWKCFLCSHAKFFHDNGNRDRNGMALPTSVMSQTTTVPARLNSFAVRQCEEINTITSNGNTTDKSLAAVQGNISRTRVDI